MRRKLNRETDVIYKINERTFFVEILFIFFILKEKRKLRYSGKCNLLDKQLKVAEIMNNKINEIESRCH